MNLILKILGLTKYSIIGIVNYQILAICCTYFSLSNFDELDTSKNIIKLKWLIINIFENTENNTSLE